MYRVILFIVILAHCSSFPFTGSNIQRSFNTIVKDDSDVVDNSGAGYSYFAKQNVGARPTLKSSISTVNQEQDISEYRYSSALDPAPKQNQMINTNNNQVFKKAFGQQQLIPQSNFEMQPPVSQTIQFQQSGVKQFDRSSLLKEFRGQQSNLLDQNAFSNQVQDVQPINSKQILLRPTVLNIAQDTLNAQRNQQQLNTIPQQQGWAPQAQQFKGFISSFNTKNQQPLSINFDKKPAVKPIIDTSYMSLPAPTRRVIAQSQFAPKVSNNDW